MNEGTTMNSLEAAKSEERLNKSIKDAQLFLHEHAGFVNGSWNFHFEGKTVTLRWETYGTGKNLTVEGLGVRRCVLLNCPLQLRTAATKQIPALIALVLEEARVVPLEADIAAQMLQADLTTRRAGRR